MPALVDTLKKIGSRTLRVATIDSHTPSPFAASLLFSYVANYIYDGDAPLAERRAQALSVDQAQLRELLGDAELRELLDADAIAALEAQLQHLDDHLRRREPGVAVGPPCERRGPAPRACPHSWDAKEAPTRTTSDRLRRQKS